VINKEWTANDLATLDRLLKTEMTMSEIGARMGRTKNSIIGKVNRLRPVDYVRPLRLKRRARPRFEAAEPQAPVVQKCKFPLWNHERPTHKYCGEQIPSGRTYCDSHAKICYSVPGPKRF